MTKKKRIGIAAVAVLTAVALVSGVLIWRSQRVVPPPDSNAPTSSIPPPAIEVDVPVGDDPAAGTTTMPVLADTGQGLTMPEIPQTTSGKTVDKIKEPDKPVKPMVPPEDGIPVPNEPTKTTQYRCGVPGHHCDGPETHAFILNLELTGCPFCGSHTCPSFYATDKWGGACYTPSRCPKYDIRKDPVYYCQKCGKKSGDGTQDTCVHYVEACHCPHCGVYVQAGACHTCQ